MCPMKNAQSLNRKYFHCTLQNKDTTVRAVCFSPEKYSELNTPQMTKSPVKITNYNMSAASSGKEDIIIQPKTRISSITSNRIDFLYLSELTTTGILPDLSAIEKLAAEQLVTIKEVAQASA